MAAFVPFINGLGFAYIGSKEFRKEWIIEGLIYEIPWFFLFAFIDYDTISGLAIALGFLLMLIGIVHSLMVCFKHKDILIDDDPESKIVIEKSVSSFWVIFSFIIFINGLGILIVGLKRNVKRWVFEGLVFELLWVLPFFTVNSSDEVFSFFLAIALGGLILSVVRTFMIYFEEERIADADYSKLSHALESPIEDSPKSVPAIDSEPISEFKHYESEINDLKGIFNKKEDDITGMINKRFTEGELSHGRFMEVINSCHRIFYHQADSALRIIHLAPEYAERLDESVKRKIGILNSIIDAMNNLIEEFILLEGADEKSEDDLKELLENMDSLIGSVKDYK